MSRTWHQETQRSKKNWRSRSKWMRFSSTFAVGPALSGIRTHSTYGIGALPGAGSVASCRTSCSRARSIFQSYPSLRACYVDRRLGSRADVEVCDERFLETEVELEVLVVGQRLGVLRGLQDEEPLAQTFLELHARLTQCRYQVVVVQADPALQFLVRDLEVRRFLHTCHLL